MINSIIAAVGENLEIGKDNDLLWSLPRDMKFFRETTMGHPIIMGRRNWDSIPKKYQPLSGRQNIILTRKEGLEIEEVEVLNDLEEAIKEAWKNEKEEVFVIGGGQIYNLALELDLVNRMYITHVKASFPEADTHFPKWKEGEWNKSILFTKEPDDKHAYGFEVCQYDKITD